MSRADPNIWLYAALMALLSRSPTIGALCVLLHLARCPVPRGPKRGLRIKRKRK